MENAHTVNQRNASIRSGAYLILSNLFNFPDPDFANKLTSGNIQQEMKRMFSELPYPLENQEILEKEFKIENYDEFQNSYIRTFEVAPGGPPCPLYEGLYYPDRRRIMEDLMRFYEHFGLKLSKPNELPDHISIELEFMHYLTYLESKALTLSKDPISFKLAQKDFLDRHLVKWLPEITRKLAKCEAPDFYKALFVFLQEFLERDLNFIKGEG